MAKYKGLCPASIGEVRWLELSHSSTTHVVYQLGMSDQICYAAKSFIHCIQLEAINPCDQIRSHILSHDPGLERVALSSTSMYDSLGGLLESTAGQRQAELVNRCGFTEQLMKTCS